jgi:hypothetical protein
MNRAHFNIPAHLGIRTARYKLVYFYDSDRGPDGVAPVRGAKPPTGTRYWEMYDLERDPHELRNVFAAPYYRSTAERLLGKLVQLREEYGDDRDGIDVGQAYRSARR